MTNSDEPMDASGAAIGVVSGRLELVVASGQDGFRRTARLHPK